jgi:hypothetical protein
MDEFEEWINKMRQGALTDPDEIRAAILRNVDPNQPPYRLELLYDEAAKTVTLRGNLAGLQDLLAIVANLARPETRPGASIRLDSASELTKNDLNLIIQLVEDNDSG